RTAAAQLRSHSLQDLDAEWTPQLYSRRRSLIFCVRRLRMSALGRIVFAMTLTQEDLRFIGFWAADCAEHVLALFETKAPSDTRPRAAIEGIRPFARGGKRTAHLRSLALAAYAAARQVCDPAAAAAARAGGLAASTAYTHPLATTNQAKHVLGPPA